MRALVTGGAGLIGSHIVDKLLERGWEVRILDCLEKPAHLKGMPPWVPPEAEFQLGGVEDPEALGRALRGVEVVFHLAAYQGFLPLFGRFWEVNGAGTARIYETIVRERLPVRKVIVSSSQAVYGEGKHECPVHGVMIPPPRAEERLSRGEWEHCCPECGGPLEARPTGEEQVDPRTMYAQSKRAQETIALELGKTYHIPTVALRYAITQGPRQSIYHAYSGVCSIFATRIVNGLPPVVYEDGNQTRDYIYAGDVAEANLLVMERPEADFQTFNVGTGVSTSVLGFLRLFAEAFGRGVEPVLADAYRLGDIRHFRCDSTKLQALGWKAKTPLKETLRRYVEWIGRQGDVRDYFSEAEAQMKGMGVIRQAGRV